MTPGNSTDLVQYVPKDQPSLPAIPRNHRNQLEERLSNQERTMAVLLEQAFRIKEDISSCLQGSHGFQKQETMARQLLENHIQTITSIVKKLSQNIQILEEQIRARDTMSTENKYASQSFNQSQLLGMGDLRGRVARCDANIEKLSGDIGIIKREYQRVEKDIQMLRSALETFSKTVDMKVMQISGKIDAYNLEQTSHLKSVQGNNFHELHLLNFKLNALTNELREQVQNQQKWTEDQLIKSEKEQLFHINQFFNIIKGKMEETNNKLEEKVDELSEKSKQFLNQKKYETEINKVKSTESKLHKRVNQVERQIWEELTKIQNEYQSGFQYIRGSLESLQQIQTTKIQLEKNKFQKDINKLHRKIVELQEM